MKFRKIIIIGGAISGFGGMETVIKKVIDLMRTEQPSIEIKLFFINHDGIAEDKTWLADNKNITVTSQFRNNKIKRWHYAYTFSRLLKAESPDAIISLDALSCYISDLARKYIFKRTPIISWAHLTLDRLYRPSYFLKADAHLSISSGITRHLIALGASPEQIYTIFNPTSPVEDTIPRPQSGTKFLYLGRVIFEEQKRVKDLLDTLALIKGDWSLDVVGNGRDLELCQNYADALGISHHITWHGWREKPWAYIEETIGSVTAMIMTSAYEGFSMAIGEAMARGIYCISSNCPTGPEDIIIENVNGSIYQLGQLNQLQHILQRLIDTNQLPEQRQIVSSIDQFYDSVYFSKIKNALNAIIQNRKGK